MNRHGYHNEHEYDEDVEEGNVEMPLPTYEEVVAASNPNIGFKEDLLVPGTSHQGSRAGSSHELPRQLASAPPTEELRRPEFRRKTCAKSYIVGLTGIVLIPLLIMLIVLQLKSCKSCDFGKDNAFDKYNVEELENCNARLEKIEKRYSDAFSELQKVKSDRDGLLIKQAATDTELKNLRYEYNSAFSEATNLQLEVERLKKEIEMYKASVTNLRNDLNKQKDS